MTSKLKIFVSAYACEPGLGSEIGVGWHWVLEMSRYFELWVLTRESNRHTIEPWIAEHPEYAGIHFLYYDWPKWARFWKKGLRGVRIYYNIWQLCTNAIVKRTMQENDIKIFHHLTYGNVLWTVSRYGRKQFFIWGPAGGVETIPKEYSRHYPVKLRMVEKLRRLIAENLRWNIGFNRRCRDADLILCKTEITHELIPYRYRHKAVLQTDVAAEQIAVNVNAPIRENNDCLKLITVGRLDAWRGFDLCIEAVAKAAETHPNVHLTIVGSGSDKPRLQRIVAELGMEKNVTFTGKVNSERYKTLMNESDAVLNASLKEGAVTVSFDCMSLGKPLICVDTTGYTRYFSDEYAILIPIKNRAQVVDDLKNGILRLRDRNVRAQMGEKALLAGQRFTWEKRGEEIYCLFKDKFEAVAKLLPLLQQRG